jgi:flavin-binding protein dodecin
MVLFAHNNERVFYVADPVYKKIELVGTSGNSFSEAAANAVAKAAQTVRNMSWFEVVQQSGQIVEGAIKQYQVTVSIGFRVD